MTLFLTSSTVFSYERRLNCGPFFFPAFYPLFSGQACKVVLQASPRNAEYQEETGVEKHTVPLSPPFLSSTQCFAEKFERNEGGMKKKNKKKKKRPSMRF